MFSGRTTTTVTAPAAAPVDYNATRPTFRELAPLFGLALITLLPVGLGGAITLWSLPKAGAELGGWGMLGLFVGGLMVLGGLRFFWPLSMVVPRAVASYYARIDEWHAAQLDKYMESDGQIQAVQVSEWEYNPLDVRKVAFALMAAYLDGSRTLSIDRLMKQGLWVRAGNKSIPLMRFTQDGAAAFLNLLAASGGITGRGPRSAGEITFGENMRTVAMRALAKALEDPRALASVEVQEAQ